VIYRIGLRGVTMDIEIRKVKTRRDLKNFIYLPEKIHAGHANWVHPIYMDERSYFDPKKNEAFSYCDTIILLAYRGEKVVGRIMGIINSKYNEHKNEKTARFGYLETWEEEEVVRALLNYVEDWAREKGYGRRWAAETAFSTFKRLFGEHSLARSMDSITRELVVKVSLYNMLVNM